MIATPQPKGASYTLPVLPFGALSMEIAYIGSTNNIDTITYYATADKTGTPIMVLTCEYAADGVADDDLLTGVTSA
jgi:hypothetical protein